MCFAPDLPPEVNALLQSAAASPREAASAELLRQAARLAPEALAVDVARYKYHCYRGELEEAERLVLGALEKAAAQGGFEADWRRLDAPPTGRDEPEHPARYYLYSLKALAFVRLRREEAAGAREALTALHRLDPEDLVGAQVVEAILERLEGDDG